MYDVGSGSFILCIHKTINNNKKILWCVVHMEVEKKDRKNERKKTQMRSEEKIATSENKKQDRKLFRVERKGIHINI